MEACSEQQPTHDRRYLCSVPNCQLNCHGSRLFARIRRLLRLRCAVCNHPHRSHSRTRHGCEKAIDTTRSVGEDMRKQWEAAKDQKENTEALIATHERALDDLSRVTGDAMNDLERLVEDYDGLALSRSFSAHMEKTIKFMEQRYPDGDSAVSEERLDNTRCGLEQMKKKLDIMRLAKAKGRGAVQKMNGNFIGN